MWLPGRLARGLCPLADGSAHILCHAFPHGRGGLFPPRLLLSRHPNGQCFTHVSSVTHPISVVKALTLVMQRAELVGDLGRRALAVRSCERLIVRDPTIDVVAMIDVGRPAPTPIMLRRDLVGAPDKSFVPDRDVLDQ